MILNNFLLFEKKKKKEWCESSQEHDVFAPPHESRCWPLTIFLKMPRPQAAPRLPVAETM